MIIIKRLGSLCILTLLLAACGANAESELLIAQHGTLAAQNTEIAGTATVQHARMQTTLDYAETRVAQAATQSQFLKATLIATGFDASSLNEFQASVSDGRIILPTPTARGAPTNFPENPAPPTSNPQGVEGAQGTPLATTPTPATGAPTLDNIVMATGVRDDDCAQQTSTTFSTTSTEIYVVATARSITPGTRITSRWRVADTEKTFDFTPDFEINGACIWFYIDQSDFAFVPGTWSVTLELNGVAVTPTPTSFTISDATTNG